MSKINETEIEGVAKLARIALKPEELTSLTIEVGKILKFVETLQLVKTDHIKPTSQVTGLNDVWREDEVVKSQITPEELLSCAPETQDGYIKVKKVL